MIFLGLPDNPGEATEPKSVQGTPSTHNISIGTPGMYNRVHAYIVLL